jgi:hypothetical protein
LVKIKTTEQAIEWCNQKLRELPSSGSDYYQSLFEVRDMIIALKTEHSLMKEVLENIRGDKCCGDCDNYYIRAGDDYEEPSNFCEFSPKKFQGEEGYCNKWLADSDAGRKAQKILLKCHSD